MTERTARPDRPNAGGPGRPEGTPAFSHREILEVFSGVALAMLMAAMDQTIVATALPTIAERLGGLDDLPWVVTSYLLTSTASTPIYGKLSDLYGRKRVLQAAILLFLAGSALCAASTSMIQLILFRGLQGLGGGGLMALAFTIIGDVVAPRERGRYQGYIGGVFALASVAGPVLGGVFTDLLSWHWIFLINLPIGVLALLMTRRALDRLPVRADGPARIDYAGAALLVGAVSSLLLVVSRGGVTLPWTSPAVLGLTALGLILLAAFVVHERRTAEPILPPRLFADRVVAIANPLVALAAMVLFSGIVFLPLHHQLVRGIGATESGLLLLPLVLGMTVGAVGGGRLIARTGRYRRFPIVGLGLAAAVNGAFAASPLLASDPLWSSLLLVPLGIGLGLVMPVMTVAVQNAVPRGDLGAATASIGFFRSLGGSVGVALFGAVLTADAVGRLAAAGLPGTDPRAVLDRGAAAFDGLPEAARLAAIGAFDAAFGTLFLVAAGLAVVGLALALRLEERPLRSGAPTGEQAREAAVRPGV